MTANKTKKKKQIAKKNAAKRANLANNDLDNESSNEALESPQLESLEAFSVQRDDDNDENDNIDDGEDNGNETNLSEGSFSEGYTAFVEAPLEQQNAEEYAPTVDKEDKGDTELVLHPACLDSELLADITSHELASDNLAMEVSTDNTSFEQENSAQTKSVDSFFEDIVEEDPSMNPLSIVNDSINQDFLRDTSAASCASQHTQEFIESPYEPIQSSHDPEEVLQDISEDITQSSSHFTDIESTSESFDNSTQDLVESHESVRLEEPQQVLSQYLSEEHSQHIHETSTQDLPEFSLIESVPEFQELPQSPSTEASQEPSEDSTSHIIQDSEEVEEAVQFPSQESSQDLPEISHFEEEQSVQEIDHQSSPDFENTDSFFDNIGYDEEIKTTEESSDMHTTGAEDGAFPPTNLDDFVAASKSQDDLFAPLPTQEDSFFSSAAVQEEPIISSAAQGEPFIQSVVQEELFASSTAEDDFFNSKVEPVNIAENDEHSKSTEISIFHEETEPVSSNPIKDTVLYKTEIADSPIELSEIPETKSIESKTNNHLTAEGSSDPESNVSTSSPESRPFVPRSKNRNSLFANDIDDKFFLELASDGPKDEKKKSHHKRHSLFGGNYSEDPFFMSLEKLTSTAEEDETEAGLDSVIEAEIPFRETELVTEEVSIVEAEVNSDEVSSRGVEISSKEIDPFGGTNDKIDPFASIQSTHEDFNESEQPGIKEEGPHVDKLSVESNGTTAEINPFELLEDDEDFLEDEVETTTLKEVPDVVTKPEASFAFLAEDDDILSDEDSSPIAQVTSTTPASSAFNQSPQRPSITQIRSASKVSSNAYDLPTNLLARNVIPPAAPKLVNIPQQNSQLPTTAKAMNLTRSHSSLSSRTSSKSFFGDLPLPNKRPANRVASAQPLVIQPPLSPHIGNPPRLSAISPPANPYAPKAIPTTPTINKNFAVSPTIPFSNNAMGANSASLNTGGSFSPLSPQGRSFDNLPPHSSSSSNMYAPKIQQQQPGASAHNPYAPVSQQYPQGSHSREYSGGYNSPTLRSNSIVSSSSPRLNDGGIPQRKPSLATSATGSSTAANTAYGDLPFSFEPPVRRHDSMRRMSNASSVSSLPPPPISGPSVNVHPNREFSNTPTNNIYASQSAYGAVPPTNPYAAPQNHSVAPSSNPYFHGDEQRYNAQANKSSLNPTELLGRQFPIFHWGAYGKTVSMIPPSMSFGTTSTRAEIKLRNVDKLMKIDDLNSKFPGPLITYSKPPLKSKKKDVEKWMKEKIIDLESHLGEKLSQHYGNKRYEHRVLLFKVVEYLLQNDGSVARNEPSLKGLRQLLCPGLANAPQNNLQNFSSVSQIYAKPSHMDQNRRTGGASEKIMDNSDSENLYNYLRLDDKESAIRYAMDKGLWAHALLIASAVSPTHWSNTVEEFVKENLRTLTSPNSDNLAFLYRLFGGSGAEAITELTASKGPVSLNNQYDKPVDNWCDVLWLALSTPTPQSGSAIVALGDNLLSTGMIEAAHICFMLSGVSGFGLSEDHIGAFSLPGSDRRYSMAQFGCDIDSIILSEVYEFCLSLRPDINYIPVVDNLLYKAYLTTVLADHGLFVEARRYNDAVFAGIKSITKGISISPSFISIVQNLGQRLLESPTDSSSSWFVGKLGKPNLENVWGTIDKNLSKFVTGDDVSSKAESQAGEKGIFGHYSRVQSSSDMTSIGNSTKMTNIVAPGTLGTSISPYSATNSPGYSSSANIYSAGNQGQSKYNRPSFEQDEANPPLYMKTIPSVNRASPAGNKYTPSTTRVSQYDSSPAGPKRSDTSPALVSYISNDDHAFRSNSANAIYNPYAPAKPIHERKPENMTQPVVVSEEAIKTHESEVSLPLLSQASNVPLQPSVNRYQNSSASSNISSRPANPYAPTSEPMVSRAVNPYAPTLGPKLSRTISYSNSDAGSDILPSTGSEPSHLYESGYSSSHHSRSASLVREQPNVSGTPKSSGSLSSHDIHGSVSLGLSSSPPIVVPGSEVKLAEKEDLTTAPFTSVNKVSDQVESLEPPVSSLPYGLADEIHVSSSDQNDTDYNNESGNISDEFEGDRFSQPISDLSTPKEQPVSDSSTPSGQPVEISHTEPIYEASGLNVVSVEHVSGDIDEESSITEYSPDAKEAPDDYDKYGFKGQPHPDHIQYSSPVDYNNDESGNGGERQSTHDVAHTVPAPVASPVNPYAPASHSRKPSVSPVNPYAPVSNSPKPANSYSTGGHPYNPYSPSSESENSRNYTPNNYTPQGEVKSVEDSNTDNFSVPYADSGYNPYAALYGSNTEEEISHSKPDEDKSHIETDTTSEYSGAITAYGNQSLEEREDEIMDIPEPVYQPPSYGIEADEEVSTPSSDYVNKGDFYTPLSSSSLYAPMAANNAATPGLSSSLQTPARTPVVEDEEEVEDLGFGNKPKKSEEQKEKESEVEKKKSDEEKKGWFGGWFKKGDQQNVVKAKLGDESSFYYDEKLKRWVNKNASAEEEAAAAGPPPPPMMKAPSARAATSSPVTSVLPPVPSSSASKISTTGGLDDLLSVTPPPGGARKAGKKNARSRYVDVLNP